MYGTSGVVSLGEGIVYSVLRALEREGAQVASTAVAESIAIAARQRPPPDSHRGATAYSLAAVVYLPHTAGIASGPAAERPAATVGGKLGCILALGPFLPA